MIRTGTEDRMLEKFNGRRAIAHVNLQALLYQVLKHATHGAPLDRRQATSLNCRRRPSTGNVEWDGAPHHVENAESCCPDVDALVPHAIKPQFWCTKVLCAPVGQHNGGGESTQLRSTVEVNQLQSPGTIEKHHVVWLDVAVDHTLGVQIVHSLEELLTQPLGGFLCEHSVHSNVPLQSIIDAQLHADCHGRWHLNNIKDADDAWMLQLLEEIVLLSG
mmetsp:Transcript_19028/g.44395  ORF Transcript_19028/g.44395 Transcript_19028/m.44395 type:complete len:218 (-) Transcript_19028:611-1264(-)